MRTQALLTMLALAAVALAGCAGDDPAGDDVDGEGGPTPDDPMGGPGTPSEPNESAPEAPMPRELFINGTVTGVLDCTLAGVDEPAQATTESVPPEAWDGDYEITFEDEAGVASLCLAWGEEAFSTSASGRVPMDVSQVRVAADGAPAGLAFSIRVTTA